MSGSERFAEWPDPVEEDPILDEQVAWHDEVFWSLRVAVFATPELHPTDRVLHERLILVRVGDRQRHLELIKALSALLAPVDDLIEGVAPERDRSLRVVDAFGCVDGDAVGSIVLLALDVVRVFDFRERIDDAERLAIGFDRKFQRREVVGNAVDLRRRHYPMLLVRPIVVVMFSAGALGTTAIAPSRLRVARKSFSRFTVSRMPDTWLGWPSMVRLSTACFSAAWTASSTRPASLGSSLPVPSASARSFAKIHLSSAASAVEQTTSISLP